MKPHSRKAICLFLLFTLFPLKAGAATYNDPMRGVEPDSARSCQGLRTVTREGLPDSDYLTFQTPSSQSGGVFGSVTYQVRGANEITVGIYTHSGSFYLYNNTDYHDIAGYILGVVNPERPFTPGNARPLLGFDGNGRWHIYATIDNTRHKLYYYPAENARAYPRVFLPETSDTKAPSGLRPYALAVWSSDGKTEAAVTMERISAEYDPLQNYCYEQFRGTFTQSGVCQVRVEINDAASLPLSDHSGYQNVTSAQLTGLASVSLSGDQLLLGPKETVRSEEEDSSPDSKAASQAASKRSGSSTSQSSSQASSAKISEPSAPVIKEVSSKFEGSVAVSEPASKTAAQTSASSKSQEKTTIIQEEPPPDEEAPIAPVVYQPVAGTAQQGRDPFAVAIGAYLTVTSGSILFVIIRSLKKK